MRAPTGNSTTQGRHGNYNAVDYSSYPDQTFYAPEDGVISSRVPNNGTCGNSLKLKGATGEHGFCHIEEYYVSVGNAVSKGQRLGKMGYTGYTIPEGPGGRHLHWILNRGGAWVYPPDFINEPFNQPQGDTNVPTLTTAQDLDNIYRDVLERDRQGQGSDVYLNKDYRWVHQDIRNSAEANAVRNAQAATSKAIQDLQVALANEKNKPPTEVIKTVEKIVEKPVEKLVEVEKTVYVHDAETKDNVSAILKIVKTIKGMVSNLFKKRG